MKKLLILLLLIPYFSFSQTKKMEDLPEITTVNEASIFLSTQNDSSKKVTLANIRTSVLTKDTIDITGNFKVSENIYTDGYIYSDSSIHLFHYYGDSTISLSYTTNWQHLTNTYNSMWINDEDVGFTVSNDTITILQSGDYDFVAKNTCGNDANEVLSIRFFNTTTSTGIPVAGAITGEGTNDFGSLPTEGYSDVDAGDEIILQYKGDASGTVVFKNGIIKIYLIHK